MKKALLSISIFALLFAFFTRRKVISQLGEVTTKPPKIRIVYSKKLKTNEREKITSSQDASRILRKLWSSQMEVREEFVVLLLDRSNRVLGYHLLSKGGLTATVADVRLIYSVALESLAAGIIIAHNHPSGNLNPSDADKLLTKKVVEAGKYFDIPVIDHVILTKESYFSFLDNGLL